MSSNVIKQLQSARRAGVPLVCVQTPDPAATVTAIVGQVKGTMRDPAAEPAFVAWDLIRGLVGLNAAGEQTVADCGITPQETCFNPIAALAAAEKMPTETVVIMHSMHRLLDQPSNLQAVWNLRDPFKATRRMLVMLGVNFQLPPELAGDVVTIDEPLPGLGELLNVVNEQYSAAALPSPSVDVETRAVEALQGLSRFAAEQVTAMSLRKQGLDLSALWERKRQQIEQTPGLRVYRGGESFEDIGGVQVVKEFLRRVMTGRAKPNTVVFVDEIEKAMAGAGGDTSGVSQDQLGVLLSYMQDHNATGVIFIGPPGSAKSAVAKACGTEGGVPTIQFDLGATKGSLVGSSEQNIRAALKVVTAVSGGRSMWIATCNSINDLPPELRRRFTLGTFFFDLPSADERAAIWDIYWPRYAIAERELSFPDDGWTGAEIRQCCEIAWRLDCPLADAATFIVPVARSAADQIQRLRTLATGRFLSASYPGVYSSKRADEQQRPKVTAKRQLVKEVS